MSLPNGDGKPPLLIDNVLCRSWVLKIDPPNNKRGLCDQKTHPSLTKKEKVFVCLQKSTATCTFCRSCTKGKHTAMVTPVLPPNIFGDCHFAPPQNSKLVTTGHCNHSHVLFHVPTPSFLEHHRIMDDRHTPCFSPIHSHHQSSAPFITFSIVCIHQCVCTPSSVFSNRSFNIIHHHNSTAANFQTRSTSNPCCNITNALAMSPWPDLSGLTASILILDFQPESRLSP